MGIIPLHTHFSHDPGPSAPGREGRDGLGPDAMPDKEFFIRRTMERNPKEGCGLLFQQYHAVLCSHAMRFVYAREVAEDLVSEVFLAFWHRQVYTQTVHSYRAYLFTAVRHRALNYLRDELGRTAQPHAVAEEMPSPLLDPGQVLQYDELAHHIGQTVSQMPPQMQKVFLMSRFEGLQAAVIAAELQLSPRTVETHIYKALGLLRKALQHEGLLAVLAWCLL